MVPPTHYLATLMMEATNVRIILGLTSTKSSGNAKMTAPSLRATLMAYLALSKAFSAVSPGVTNSGLMMRGSTAQSRSRKKRWLTIRNPKLAGLIPSTLKRPQSLPKLIHTALAIPVANSGGYQKACPPGQRGRVLTTRGAFPHDAMLVDRNEGGSRECILFVCTLLG